MQESSKAAIRRFHDSRFVTRYFKGSGIDIGCGDDPLSKFSQQFPLMTALRPWDIQDGDAQLMAGVEDDSYDFVTSSHCLEHMVDPIEAFRNWVRICRPGGHLVVLVPDEDLYEQGVWPSTFNPDHKTTWTIMKDVSWSPVSVNIVEFLFNFRTQIEVVKIERNDSAFVTGIHRVDQTYHGIAESSVEFIVRKKGW